MKRTIKLISKIILGALIVSLYSCSDEFFDSPDGNQIDPAEQYSTTLDADLAYGGCLSLLQDVVEDMVLVDGLRSDMMNVTSFADKDMIDIYNHNLSTTNPYLDLSNFYKVIINVNEVLPHLAGIMLTDKDFDSTIFNIYYGALATVRAWSYFNIARMCNGAYILDTASTSIDAEPVYMGKKELIDKLIADLIPYYDEEDLTRFPIEYHALMGEMYLEINEYEKAVEYLKRSVDGEDVEYMVSTDYKDKNWVNIFMNSVSQGATVMSVVPYEYRQGQPGMLSLWMNELYMVKPSQPIINAFESQVGLKGAIGDVFRGLDITYTYDVDENPVINKYNLVEDPPYSADVIIYRAADIHLLLAEAMNRMGDTLAMVLVNKGMSQFSKRPEGFENWSKNAGVRGRVGLADVTVDVHNIALVENVIIQERAMELAFEGKRWFDLVRIANRRGNPAYLANIVAAKFPDAEKAAITNKLMNTNNWYIDLQSK